LLDFYCVYAYLFSITVPPENMRQYGSELSIGTDIMTHINILLY